MTPADETARLRATVDRKDEQMAVLQGEIDRLRRELAACIEAARENGSERDELAMNLGAEVAQTERYKKSIAITDENVRRMQNELNALRAALRDALDFAEDCHGQMQSDYFRERYQEWLNDVLKNGRDALSYTKDRDGQ